MMPEVSTSFGKAVQELGPDHDIASYNMCSGPIRDESPFRLPLRYHSPSDHRQTGVRHCCDFSTGHE